MSYLYQIVDSIEPARAISMSNVNGNLDIVTVIETVSAGAILSIVGSKKLPIPDFPSFFAGILVFSGRSWSRFEKNVSDLGDFAFRTVSGEAFVFFRPTVKLQCLDIQKSEFRWFSSGETIQRVEKYAVQRNKKSYFPMLFKIQGEHRIFDLNIICNQSFVNIYEEEGFSGLKFKSVDIIDY